MKVLHFVSPIIYLNFLNLFAVIYQDNYDENEANDSKRIINKQENVSSNSLDGVCIPENENLSESFLKYL